VSEDPSTTYMGMKVNDTYMGVKVGRNDPCPCGSGKKFKQRLLPRQAGVSRTPLRLDRFVVVHRQLLEFFLAEVFFVHAHLLQCAKP
jgi:hypothetical protein